MKLKVKKLQFEASDYKIVVINEKDAIRLGQNAGERVLLRKVSQNKHMEKLFVAILDIAYSDSIVAPGEIGIFRDLFNQFENIEEDSIISIKPAEKPQSFQYIKKKIEGKKLNSIEINKIIEDTVSGYLSQIELSAFITGASIHGLDNEEITSLTIAETMNGEILNFGTEVYDKHSTYIST